MTENTSFTGFSKETVKFFTGLKKNNNREWFARNKEIFDRHVIEPAKLFVTAMGARLKEIAPRIVAVPAVNKSIFRIYRDTRFSLDPTPYKTHLGILFWDGTRAKMESSGFYFQLDPPNMYLGGGMYVIPDDLLGRYRKAVADPKRGTELAKILAAIRGLPGFSIEGDRYKRVPAGFDPGHPNAELLKHKGLWAGFEAKVPEEFYSARLVEYCFTRFEPLAPFHRWLMKLLG